MAACCGPKKSLHGSRVSTGHGDHDVRFLLSLVVVMCSRFQVHSWKQFDRGFSELLRLCNHLILVVQNMPILIQYLIMKPTTTPNNDKRMVTQVLVLVLLLILILTVVVVGTVWRPCPGSVTISLYTAPPQELPDFRKHPQNTRGKSIPLWSCWLGVVAIYTACSLFKVHGLRLTVSGLSTCSTISTYMYTYTYIHICIHTYIYIKMLAVAAGTTRISS